MSTERPTFALIGGNGYIGPRHGRAIKDVGGDLVVVVDPNRVAGWLDTDWPEAKFIPESFSGSTFHHPLWPSNLDYIVICTPNSMHAQHAVVALRETDVICEKPLGLKWRHLQRMVWAEKKDGHRLWTILQLRHQAGALAAKKAIEGRAVESAEITYHALRGHWYSQTWKGVQRRSGGLIFNIGSHPVDLASWLFGQPRGHWVNAWTPHSLDVTGEFGSTMVRIRLSTREPKVTRVLDIEGVGLFDLSESFGNLHAACYRDILAEEGLGVSDVSQSVEWCARVAGEVLV